MYDKWLVQAGVREMNTTIRTLKIVTATLLAILLAQALGLQHPLASGVIAILSVLETKQESIKTASARIGSTIIGFSIASLFFYAFGYTILAFCLYLLFFIPITCKGNLQSGIAPTTVLVTHFMTAMSISWKWQVNGFALMIIGVGMALMVNSWMPSQQKELNRLKEEIEKEMRVALVMFQSQLLGERNFSLIFNHLKHLDSKTHEMNQLAFKEYENQIVNHSGYFIRYAQMRKEQVIVLQKIYDNLPLIKLATKQNEVLADLFIETAEQLHEKNTGLQLLNDISDLYIEFKKTDLPKSRTEFESRASLFQILNDFERFIKIKREFYINEQDMLD